MYNSGKTCGEEDDADKHREKGRGGYGIRKDGIPQENYSKEHGRETGSEGEDRKNVREVHGKSICARLLKGGKANCCSDRREGGEVRRDDGDEEEARPQEYCGCGGTTEENACGQVIGCPYALIGE